MHDKLEVIHKYNKPFGIRDSGGFLFFFPQVTKYTGQEKRYCDEIFEQFELADFLLNALQGRSAKKEGKNLHTNNSVRDAICAFSGQCQYQNNGTAKTCKLPEYIHGCSHRQHP